MKSGDTVAILFASSMWPLRMRHGTVGTRAPDKTERLDENASSGSLALLGFDGLALALRGKMQGKIAF